MKRVLRHISIFEKTHYPLTRQKLWYLWLKLIILLPLVLIAQLQRLVHYTRTRPWKLQKADKPPIVLSNIISGFANLAFPNESVEAMATKRATICSTCPAAEKVGVYSVVVDNRTKEIQGMRCSDCGCNLSAKVRSERDYCPRGKW